MYKKTNITIDSIITGGNQEFGLRAGTENVPYIIGFAESINITEKLKATEYSRLNELQKFMESLLASKMTIPFLVNGLNSERIPNIVNISISNLSSEEIVIRLAAKGVLASVKSACKSGEDGDSHVIRALRDTNTQSIRFSMGRSTTRKDIEYTVKTLVLITQKMQETFLVYGK